MRTVLDGATVGLTYSLLKIAEGTPHEVLVRDVRRPGRWSEPSAVPVIRNPPIVVYHHTAGGRPDNLTPMQQLQVMEVMRGDAPWGLPYNFVVFPGRRGRTWYLNDVDQAWPHTYTMNGAVGIAAWGNYDLLKPDPLMVGRMLAVADALATMWGLFVPELQHQDVNATACPGRYLSPLLPREGRQRA